jgi:RimK family alpha-L-glutamate ligase
MAVVVPVRDGTATAVPSRVLLVGDPHGETNVGLAERWRELGLVVDVVPGDALTDGIPAATVVLGRLDVLPGLDGVVPGLYRLLHLERTGHPVLNRAFGLVAAHDKLVTARVLAHAGIPAPATMHIRLDERPRLSPPVVVKPRFGSWGRDVFRCNSRLALAHCLEVLAERPWFLRHGAIVQELVPSSRRDLRLVVAGDAVVGAVERRAAPGEWRTNISLGGTLHPVVPPPGTEELARAVAAALGLDLVGVDLLPGANGWRVIEANAAVDFDARYSVPGDRDVYEVAAESLSLLAPAAARSRRRWTTTSDDG